MRSDAQITSTSFVVVSKTKREKAISLLEIYARKARTLFSMLHSGVLLLGDGINPLSMSHYDRLRYIEFRPFLNFKEDVVVYDVGANIGEMARFFAGFPSVSAIYCFEPIRHVFAQLIRNTSDQEKIQCFPVALGDRNGTTKMHINKFSSSSSILQMDPLHVEEFPLRENVSEGGVPIMTLEEAVATYHLAKPDFIKIDVQGFEDRVVRGGAKIIKEAGFCLVELSLVQLYEGSSLITEMNLLMRNLGFRLTNIIGTIKGKSNEILQIDGLYKNDLLLV